MVLILSIVWVTVSDCGLLSKIVLCKFMGIIGLHKYRHYGTCPLLKGKGKVHPCTGTGALYSRYGP
jgi:hypothetical protein